MTLLNVSFFSLLFFLTLLTSDLSSCSWRSCHGWPQAGVQTQGNIWHQFSAAVVYLETKGPGSTALQAATKNEGYMELKRRTDEGSRKFSNTDHSCKSKQSCRKSVQQCLGLSEYTNTPRAHCPWSRDKLAPREEQIIQTHLTKYQSCEEKG